MSSQVLAPSTESAMLARILQADEQELSLDAARYWLSVKLPATDQDRVDELSARARAGSLTEAEGEERRCSGGVLTGRNVDRAPGVRARIPKRERFERRKRHAGGFAARSSSRRLETRMRVCSSS